MLENVVARKEKFSLYLFFLGEIYKFFFDVLFSLDISVIMESPRDPGIYQSKWRMSTMTGNFFG